MARQPADAVALQRGSDPGRQGKPVPPKRSNASRLFGHDIFVSFALGPPPRGTHSYASDLARRLRERDFAVFFSEDEAPPGEQLDSTLRRALHRSKTLVVVANRGTLQEPRWVRTEVEEFRSRHPTRPIIPISVDGALQDPALAAEAQQWLKFQDRIWLDESREAAANGIASEALVERLAMAPARLKSNVGWRWVVRGIVASLAMLAIALAFATKMANDSAERARAELRRAVSLRLVAEGQDMLSGTRAGGDERALLQLLAASRIAPGAQVDGALLAALVERRDLLKLIPVGVPVHAIAPSADGRRIISGGGYALTHGKIDDDSLRSWETATGKQIGAPFEGHESLVLSIAFSGDGTRIVSGSADHTVRLWNPDSGQAVGAPLAGHESAVTSVAFSPDGKRIVSGSQDNTLRLWDVKSGEVIGTPLQGHGTGVSSVAFTSDGSRIVSGSLDRSVRWWDGRTGAAMGELVAAPLPVTSLALSPDDRRIVSAMYTPGGSSDVFTPAILQVWDARTGQPIGAPMGGHTNPVRTVAFSPDGSRIISGSEDLTLRLWDASTGQPLGRPLQGHSGSINSVAFSRDGTRIFSGGEDGTLRVWNADIDAPIGTVLETHSTWLSSVAFSPDSHRVAAGGLDGTVRVWDPRTRQQIAAPLERHDNMVTSIAFSPDGSRIVSSSTDGTLRLWNSNTGRSIGEPLRGHIGAVTQGVFSPDGSRIVSTSTAVHRSSTDYDLRLWDARTGSEVVASFRGLEGPVTKVGYSSDGRHIIAVANGEQRLWDADTYEPAGVRPEGAPLEFDERVVPGVVAFSADASRALSGSRDGTLRLWDTATGEPIGLPMTGHTAEVASVAYSPDGRYLASGGEDDTLRLWPGPAGWPRELCAKLTRNMSRKQWREWVSPEIEYVCQCADLPVALDDATPGAPVELCPR